MPNLELFDWSDPGRETRLGPNARILHGFALSRVDAILLALSTIEAASPFRHMVTPGGQTMSAALTNCGRLGWTSDGLGYRYRRTDPTTGQPWPAMPSVFAALAQEAAQAVGFEDFKPDACLINRYPPGSRLTLHQDRNERDFSAPIVSVSLGVTATFLFGGLARSDRTARIALSHGDVAVWGGADRLRYHGILPVPDESHARLGRQRINLTLRKAG